MSPFRLCLLCSTIGLMAFAESALAIFARVEVEKVPIDRLVKNLEEAIKKNPKDAKAVLNLARLHAMAFSLRSEEIPVDKRKPNDVWFGYEPPLVPFRNLQKTDDPARLAAAKAHLEKALKLYEEATKLDANDLRAQLGYGWLLTQADRKAEAIPILRKVAEEGWKSDEKLKSIFPGKTVYTPEVAGYLVPLLDKNNDREEIAKLDERKAQLRRLPRAITPIAVSLKPGRTAAEVEDRNASVPFDADGSGLTRNWTWIQRDAAWLVHDPAKSGKITSALQMFGNVTFWLFWETGYDAMAGLDDNRDGKLSGSELHGLALWHDANGNGVSDAGEVRPLSSFGIVSLSCQYDRDSSHPDHLAFSRLGVTFADGTTRPTYDIVLHLVNRSMD